MTRYIDEGLPKVPKLKCRGSLNRGAQWSGRSRSLRTLLHKTSPKAAHPPGGYINALYCTYSSSAQSRNKVAPELEASLPLLTGTGSRQDATLMRETNALLIQYAMLPCSQLRKSGRCPIRYAHTEKDAPQQTTEGVAEKPVAPTSTWCAVVRTVLGVWHRASCLGGGAWSIAKSIVLARSIDQLTILSLWIRSVGRGLSH